ncbi:hypothetical protein D8674_010663 [Pyrus ussuriensis x Pyrus communis]|uniref:TMV resistance protein N-like n=1 Tax=Pyrus ussuriensis x Pyrus communis TaxID=2448454 RepID=A0A5N5FGM3_9ROSA|nr:hypothetical protein D8674_010663 [Pyrus ussuriensis x Pyrus communis]
MHCGTFYRLRFPSKVAIQATQGNPDEANIEQEEEEVDDALILQEAATVATRQGASPSQPLENLRISLRCLAKRSTLALAIEQVYVPSPSLIPPAIVTTLTSQFNPATGEMLRFVADDSNSSSLLPEVAKSPTPITKVLKAPKILVVSKMTSHRASTMPTSSSKPPFPKAALVITPLPKAYDPPKASSEGLSKPSQPAVRGVVPNGPSQVNGVPGIPILRPKKQLVEERSAREDRIMVIVAEIQKLEQQLFALKAEQITLSSKLYKKIEEVKKVNQQVEDSESQLANSNIALEEPSRIFTIMQTYHSRIAALAKNVKL